MPLQGAPHSPLCFCDLDIWSRYLWGGGGGEPWPLSFAFGQLVEPSQHENSFRTERSARFSWKPNLLWGSDRELRLRFLFILFYARSFVKYSLCSTAILHYCLRPFSHCGNSSKLFHRPPPQSLNLGIFLRLAPSFLRMHGHECTVSADLAFKGGIASRRLLSFHRNQVL